MFDVENRGVLPVDVVEIMSFAVRGELGPVTVWISPGGCEGKLYKKSAWQLYFDEEVLPSWRVPVELQLREPVKLRTGERVGVFIHSRRPGDEAIVYDNAGGSGRDLDPCLAMYPGYASLSSVAFSRDGPWGEPWRSRRSFVGEVRYGVRWRLWDPEQKVQNHFGPIFRRVIWLFLLGARDSHSCLSWCNDEVLFHILHLCSWDWFGDTVHAGRYAPLERPWGFTAVTSSASSAPRAAFRFMFKCCSRRRGFAELR